MVSEIQVDDPELEEQLLKEVHENGNMASSAQIPGSVHYLYTFTYVAYILATVKPILSSHPRGCTKTVCLRQVTP